MLVAAGATAEQARLENYFEAIPIFWQEVYPDGGETLYCGEHFGARKDRSFNIEHVYPMAWAMKAEGCRERNQCRHSSKRFNRMESDMHNFYPARKDINKIRGSFPFGTIRGEERRYGKCDFEFDARKRVVEPRPASRGNIARSMFYMKDTYGLKIYSRQGQLLQRWNRDDPPDDQERQRNNLIEKLQGTRNRFIDQPQLAEKLRF